jgi:alanine dehydrogenase
VAQVRLRSSGAACRLGGGPPKTAYTSRVLKLQKTGTASAITGNTRCSFCNGEAADGRHLIAGPGVFICDACIATCNDMLADENAAVDETAAADDDAAADDEDAAADERAPADESAATEESAATLEAHPASDDEGDAIADHPIRRAVFFRLLTEADVARLITMDDLIDSMEDALRRFSSGEVVQPVRTVLPVGDDNAFFGLMPAFVREPAAIGAKLLTVFARNAANDLPTHLATILLFSPQTGALVAVMGGGLITESRTAAVSAISARLLARDDAAVAAIIGSGPQARSHLEALERVFELTEVRVWSPTPEHQAAFVDEMESITQARLVGAGSAEQAVRGADVVVLATSSHEPVVQNEWVKDGGHVISVGACRPDQREMDPALTRRGRLFVDSRAAALVESGDIVMGIQEHRFAASHIIGELGELLAGKVEGRRSPRDVTIFKSLGLAVEDVVAADLVYRRAVEQDAGLELDL